MTCTIINACAAIEADLKKSPTPGRYADFAVLSQNLLTVAADAGIYPDLSGRTVQGPENKKA
mgnify:FL=1